MNPFLNPITGIPFIKNFIFDPGRLHRFSPKKMKIYRDKNLRKIVKYAYTASLYHTRYKKTGIYPDDIKEIKDITKLPFVTKRDLVEYFPDGIVPIDYNKERAQVVSTGGSTGKPVSIYTDFSVMSGGIGASIRTLKNLNLHWRKSRIVQVGNYSPGKADAAAEGILYSKARSLHFLGNYKFMNAFNPIKDIVKRLDEYKPDMILSYPATFQHLAYLKKKGYGENINPRVLISSASVLDQYTRSYVEDAFGCRILNVYGSTETSSESAIAFECMEGTWHINYDYFHVAAIDENMEVVDEGERGDIVVTRLFGRGTPIVRYTGVDDWVTLLQEYECSCGLCTPIIKGGVEGRVSSSIILPDGRLFPAASFASLYVVLKDLKTKKVRQFQIVQKKIDEIDILLVIDEDLRNIGPSIDLIFKKIKEIHQKKTGLQVAINVKEVKEIKSLKGKPAPLVISHVTPEKSFKVIGW